VGRKLRKGICWHSPVVTQDRLSEVAPGIGEKYARNIMMDVYHEDFRDSIAIDSRILAISAKWGLRFKSFSDHEAFYLAVASGLV